MEFADNYETYKKNIPTFFFDANIMNEAIHRNEMDRIREELHDTQDDNNSAVQGDDEQDENDENGSSSTSSEALELPKEEKYAIVVIKPHVSSYQIETIQDMFADDNIEIHKQKAMNVPYESIKEILSFEYDNEYIIEAMAKDMTESEILVYLISAKIKKYEYL